MSDLTTDIDNLKKTYREIFLKTSEEINAQIENIKPENPCTSCDKNCVLNVDIFEQFPKDCEYKNWQKNVIKLFDEEMLKNVYQKWIKILDYRENFSCSGCASCCKLACSEFSYEELLEKAKNGDNFATQFTSVFVPYNSEEEAREVYPEYLEMLKEKLDGDSVYFYHCPKLTKEDRCSDYENRPSICSDFPNNPLSLLPKSCGYKNWKEEVEPTALMLHSMLEIIDFYKGKLKAL